MNKNEFNETLHHMWWKGIITVSQHCDMYYEKYKDYPYDCTFKADWLNQYYSWLVEKEHNLKEEKNGRFKKN